MSESYLVASDIDRTLMFSGQYISDHKLEGQWVETESNGWCGSGYMAPEALRALSTLRALETQGRVKFVPATSRCTAEFKRISWSNKVQFAIVANGGVILCGGEKLKQYAAYLDQELGNYKGRIERLAERIASRALEKLLRNGVWCVDYEAVCRAVNPGVFSDVEPDLDSGSGFTSGSNTSECLGRTPGMTPVRLLRKSGGGFIETDAVSDCSNEQQSSGAARESDIADGFDRADYWGFKDEEGFKVVPLIVDAIAKMCSCEHHGMKAKQQKVLEISESGLETLEDARAPECAEISELGLDWETKLQTFKMIDKCGILIRMPKKLISEFIKEFQTDFDELQIDALCSEEKIYLFPKGLDKSTALKWLHEKLMPGATVLAAGDADPDLTMLQYAGHAFIPEGSCLAQRLCINGKVTVEDTEVWMGSPVVGTLRGVDCGGRDSCDECATVSALDGKSDTCKSKSNRLKCEILRSGLGFSEDFLCRVLRAVGHM